MTDFFYEVAFDREELYSSRKGKQVVKKFFRILRLKYHTASIVLLEKAKSSEKSEKCKKMKKKK